MGKINIIGKYDLNKGIWDFKDKNNSSTSLAIAEYDPIKQNDGSKYNYIIYCYGSRVEDHSKDYQNIKQSKAHVDKILNYFKRKRHNIIVKFIMLDKDAPLKEDGIILANYINRLLQRKDCNSINILGYSKSGVMFFDMIKYINPKDRNKINLYNIATPYTGTKMASPKIFYQDIKNMVNTHLPNEILANTIYEKLIHFYESICSNSHMDYDIAIPNGIPEDRLDKYDSSLIKNLLAQENLEAIRSINRFQNFTTGIDNTTFKRALIKGNFVGIGMCLIDDLLMNKGSDGFVYTKSENEINKYLEIKNKHIKGAHHDLMSDNIYSNEILYDINENLEEDREKILKK